MKVYWWQGGVHFHPESDEEHEALQVLTDVIFRDLKVVSLAEKVPAEDIASVDV